MKRGCERGLAWLVLLTSTVSIAACEADRLDPEVGSDTNWLQACDTDGDCRGSQCRCGLCTLSCSDLGACGAIEEAQLCVETSQLSATSCRLGFAEPVASGVCTRGCRVDADCGPGGGSAVYCFEGVCLPGVAATPRGSIASVANGATGATGTATDGGREDAASGAGGSNATAGSGAAGDGGSTGPNGVNAGAGGAQADAGDADARDAASDEGSVASTGEGQLAGGRPLISAESGTSFENPYPEPQCPCESDLPAAEPAPAPGEAPANAYGNPSLPAEPSDSPLAGGSSYLKCGVGAKHGSYWFVAETDCVRYENCNHACRTDGDCPSGGSGSARPRCSTLGYCFLDCRDDMSCPDGMSCVSGRDGAACYWARDVLAPECPAYCRQRPPPRECDNWCADLLVACNPGAGVNCCAGLTCTTGGYCDDAP